jgi:hypothetical protein
MSVPQWLVALDQFGNTLIRDYAGGPLGWADETISSRAWRLSASSAVWAKRREWIDRLFLKLAGQRGHCFDSYVSEQLRRHFPPELRGVEVGPLNVAINSVEHQP